MEAIYRLASDQRGIQDAQEAVLLVGLALAAIAPIKAVGRGVFAALSSAAARVASTI